MWLFDTIMTLLLNWSVLEWLNNICNFSFFIWISWIPYTNCNVIHKASSPTPRNANMLKYRQTKQSGFVLILNSTWINCASMCSAKCNLPSAIFLIRMEFWRSFAIVNLLWYPSNAQCNVAFVLITDFKTSSCCILITFNGQICYKIY